MQMYGCFEGFTLNSALFGLVSFSRFGLPFLLRWRENAAWRILSTHLTGALASCKTGGAPADRNSM